MNPGNLHTEIHGAETQGVASWRCVALFMRRNRQGSPKTAGRIEDDEWGICDADHAECSGMTTRWNEETGQRPLMIKPPGSGSQIPSGQLRARAQLQGFTDSIHGWIKMAGTRWFVPLV